MSDTTLIRTGVPSASDIEKVTPPQELREKGPIVMIECFQEIPCDPCAYACKFDAIKEFEDINHIPKTEWAKCTGCGLCVAACPGLAIFLVDESAKDGTCRILMPYEQSPLPVKGQEVDLLDRAGAVVGKGTVERVIPGRKPQGTPVVWVKAPKELSLVARNLRTV